MGLNAVISEFGVTNSRVKQFVKSAVESGNPDKIKDVKDTLQTIAFASASKMERFGCVDGEAAADLLNKYNL